MQLVSQSAYVTWEVQNTRLGRHSQEPHVLGLTLQSVMSH